MLFFTTNPAVGAKYANAYGAGLHQIQIPRPVYEGLQLSGGIVPDNIGLELDSVIVKPEALNTFSDTSVLTYFEPKSWDLYEKFNTE